MRSNDPARAILPLTIRGKVTKVVDVSPAYVRFNGMVGKEIVRKITVTPLEDYPFKIKSVNVKKSEEIDVSWKEVKTDSGIKYEILAVSTKKTPGSCRNTITINTDSKVKPQITIGVGGSLLPPQKQS